MFVALVDKHLTVFPDLEDIILSPEINFKNLICCLEADGYFSWPYLSLSLSSNFFFFYKNENCAILKAGLSSTPGNEVNYNCSTNIVYICWLGRLKKII